jgi:hypothetical protein
MHKRTGPYGHVSQATPTAQTGSPPPRTVHYDISGEADAADSFEGVPRKAAPVKRPASLAGAVPVTESPAMPGSTPIALRDLSCEERIAAPLTGTATPPAADPAEYAVGDSSSDDEAKTARISLDTMS